MAANEKQTPRDPSGFPLPSTFNAAADRHDVVYGAGNAPRTRIADGDDEALGSRSDAAASGALTGEFTVVSLLKDILAQRRSLNL